MHERAEVFRQARAAERVARTEIGLRDVELPVHQEDAHDLVRVGPERRAHVTDLVREAYLEGMKRVRNVLDHLRRPHRRVDEWRGDVGIERAEHGGGLSIVAPDQGKRGMREVSQRGALPHELRVHGDA